MDILIYIYIYIYIASTSPDIIIWDLITSSVDLLPLRLCSNYNTLLANSSLPPLAPLMIQDVQSIVFSTMDQRYWSNISLLMYQTRLAHLVISAATDVDRTPPRLFAQRYVRVHESTNISLSYLTTDEINESLHSMHRNGWRSAFADFYLWSQTSLSSEILVRFLFSLLCCLGAQEFESDSNSWAKFIILR